MQKQISNERSLKLKEFGLNQNFQYSFFDELVKTHPGFVIPIEDFPLVYHFENGKFNEKALFINGRVPNEPFSLLKCKMTKKQYNKHNSNRSFRDALNETIKAELIKLTNGTYTGTCCKCGDIVNKKSDAGVDCKFIHIDHFGEKQFINIKNEFLKLHSLTDEDVLPSELITYWIDFHNNYAKLRILCNICNCKKHNDLA